MSVNIIRYEIVNTEKELRKEINRIKSDKELKPHHQGMLLDMMLKTYAALISNTVERYKLYGLEKGEVKFFKSNKFQLPWYPFSCYEIDTTSKFYKKGVSIVHQILNNKKKNRFELRYLIREAIAYFEIASYKSPEPINTELKLYNWDLDVINGLFIDFRRSTWDKYFRIISKRMEITIEEFMLVRKDLYSTINKIEAIMKEYYDMSSIISEDKIDNINNLEQYKHILVETIKNNKFEKENLLSDIIGDNITDKRTSVIFSVIKRYMQKPMQIRVKKIVYEQFGEFKSNLNIIKYALELVEKEVNNPFNKVPKHISDYFKLNLLDPDFVGKHSLTFEDKDIFTIVVILEEILSGIIEYSINPYFKDLFSSIFKDENSITLAQETKNWNKKDYQSFMTDALNYVSEKLDFSDDVFNRKLIIDQQWYGEGLETFLNYNWGYEIYSKSIFKIDRIYFPEFKKEISKMVIELLSSFRLLYSKLYENYKITLDSMININYDRITLTQINEYLHYLQLKAEGEIPAFTFSPSRDFELRELSKNLFGMDIFSQNRYNLSNRPQLKQLALGFQYIYKILDNTDDNEYWHSDEFVNAI